MRIYQDGKMISRKRKTLAVCSVCHHKIHSGKLD
ncbi:hypothetical protein [Parabacteroides distasonis]